MYNQAPFNLVLNNDDDGMVGRREGNGSKDKKSVLDGKRKTPRPSPLRFPRSKDSFPSKVGWRIAHGVFALFSSSAFSLFSSPPFLSVSFRALFALFFFFFVNFFFTLVSSFFFSFLSANLPFFQAFFVQSETKHVFHFQKSGNSANSDRVRRAKEDEQKGGEGDKERERNEEKERENTVVIGGGALKFSGSKMYPSRLPTTRDEVKWLEDSLRAMLKVLSMHLFLFHSSYRQPPFLESTSLSIYLCTIAFNLILCYFQMNSPTIYLSIYLIPSNLCLSTHLSFSLSLCEGVPGRIKDRRRTPCRRSPRSPQI